MGQDVKTDSDTEVSVFDYLDYRKFLREWLENAKVAYGFSYRVFSRQAGFRSPSIFKLVMDGDRNLTDDSLKKFIKGLNLSKPEREYFRNLVHFNQAKSHTEKNTFYRKLISSREYSKLKPIVKDQYEYFSTWYHPVVRELVISPDFDGKLEWIGKQINPQISTDKVKRSVELLERLGFIERTDNGNPPIWQQSTPLVTSGPEAVTVPLFNYHRSVLELVRNQMTEVEGERRDVSALTLGVVRERLPQIKKKIQEFRSEILKLVSSDTEPEEVVLLSMQLLPVTRSDKQGD